MPITDTTPIESARDGEITYADGTTDRVAPWTLRMERLAQSFNFNENFGAGNRT